MSPRFVDGEMVQFKTLKNENIIAGDIVLAYHPFIKKIKIVKRVKNINTDGDFFLQGDNPVKSFSSDSRSFGYIKRKEIIAILKEKR